MNSPANTDARTEVTTQTEDPSEAALQDIISRNRQRAGGMISLLEDIQATFGYLSERALTAVAEEFDRTLVDVYGVATFYKAFSLEPRGKHLVSVCLGTACHVRGAPRIAEEFERRLGVQPGRTSADGEFTLETVNCLGACALGPVVVVDGHYFPHQKAAVVGETIAKVREGLNNVEVGSDERVFPIEVRCPRCNHSLMDSQRPVDGHPSIRLTAFFDGKHCSIGLSSLYGSYNVDCKYEIPQDTVIHFFCRRCHHRLVGASSCPECEAPMAPLFVRGGGLLQFCTRRGCPGHMLDLGDNVVE